MPRIKRQHRFNKTSSSKTRHETAPIRHKGDTAEETKSWVGSSLLSTMDTMEQHVQEMLDLGHHPVQLTSSTTITPLSNSTTLKAYILREINARVDSKLSAIVDTAITARMNRLEVPHKTEQTNIGTLQTSRDYDRRMLNDLNVFHRHEHSLNTALVERLFHTASLEGDPDARFDGTTFDLQNTDSVNSVLVSHVEPLVMKVQQLEEQVKGLQQVLTA